MLSLKGFSIGEMIKRGWERFKAHWGTWISALVVFGLLLLVHSFVADWIQTRDFNQSLNNLSNIYLGSRDFNAESDVSLWQFVSTLIFIILEFGLTLGLIYMSIRSARGQSIHLGHLFARFQYVFQYLFGSILYSLVIFAGLLLFIFPALIWAAKFGLFSYFIADKGTGPITSMKLSSQVTNGAKWDVSAANIMGLISFTIGAFPLGLGWLIVFPVYCLAWAFIYLHLVNVPAVAVAESLVENS